MSNDDSRVVQNALKYVNEAYAFMLKQGYEVFSAKEIPMGWQIILRKQDLFVRILQMRGDEDVHFQKTTQPPDDFGLGYFGSEEFVDIGSVVYAATGEIIPVSYGGYSKEFQKYLDKIETYFEGEYSTNKDSLRAAQKDYHETLSPKEEMSPRKPEIRPILYYPLKAIIMLLLLGALTTLYAVLLERLSSAFSLDIGSYGILMLAASVLLAIVTMFPIRSFGFAQKVYRKALSLVKVTSPEKQRIPPLVVQAIENLFPDIDHQGIAFMCISELKESGRAFRDEKLFLALLAYSDGEIQKLRLAVSNVRYSAHFRWEEIDPIFPKRRNAEEWVKSITKTQT